MRNVMSLHRRSVLAGLSAALIAPAAYAQSERFAEAALYSAARRGVSLVVMEGGRTIFEDYPNEGGPDRDWELASGTKSFCGVIAAAAAADGLLDIDEHCADTLPEWRGDRRVQITIRHLLTLTSGIVDTRIGIAPSYARAIATPATAEPGAHFAYGPTPFQIFGEIMRRKLAAMRGAKDAAAYLRQRVLNPIGVRASSWRTGRDGMPLMRATGLLSANLCLAADGGSIPLHCARALSPAAPTQVMASPGGYCGPASFRPGQAQASTALSARRSRAKTSSWRRALAISGSTSCAVAVW
jgi:CubicO group peptidase (beta-lactamase class C family)